MRRAFVIFLILLFPLNVFALSMSVSSIQGTGANEHVMTSLPGGSGFDTNMEAAPLGDLDPDEPPPSGMDHHDSVSLLDDTLAALPSDSLVSPHVPLRHGLAPHPPIKPPPVR